MDEAELAAIRGWVGSLPSDDEIEEIYNRLGNFDATVLEILRTRLADYTSEPSSLSVPGLSISNTSNISALQQLISDFENSGGLGLDDDPLAMGFGTGRLVRKNGR